MINEDVVIKFFRPLCWGCDNKWPEVSFKFLKSLEELKKGFPGIRNDHLDLLYYSDIKEDDIFITLEETPFMYRLLENGDYFIEGIGCGPDDSLRRWQDTIKSYLSPSDIVLRVNCRPNENGGPGYYYFFRSYRDFRK